MLVIVAIFGAVLVVTISSVWREATQNRALRISELNATANVFASSISGYVDEDDKPSTLNALRAIGQIPNVSYIQVTSVDGSLFVELGNSVQLENASSAHVLWRKPLEYFFTSSNTATASIIRGGEKIGELSLHSNNEATAERIVQILSDAGMAAIFAAAIGLLIALKMQRSITDPILELAGIMGKIREKAISPRARRSADR